VRLFLPNRSVSQPVKDESKMMQAAEATATKTVTTPRFTRLRDDV
jgi:hypothetical protein